MPELSFKDRARTVYRRFQRGGRDASTIVRAPVAEWSQRKFSSDQLLIVPQELRTADPSLIADIRSGYFGLGGATVELEGRSPFMVKPPTKAWLEALHGFAWLSDLRADGGKQSLEFARQSVTDWIEGQVVDDGPAWRPEIMARRVMAFLGNSGFLLEHADQKLYDLFATSLMKQLKLLARGAPRAPAGLPRLTAETAIVMAGLCMADLESVLDRHLPIFLAELEKQVLKDGGHVSRNEALLVEILLDCLPLKQCFVARSREIPKPLNLAIQRMLGMLRHMQLPDGSLARFNGVSATPLDRLAAVLAFDEAAHRPGLGALTPSRYPKIQRRRLVLIADCGSPPTGDLAATAQAGCLSFELCSGDQMLIVNAGWPGAADLARSDDARGTAAQSTLVLSNTPSSRLIRRKSRGEGQMISGISGPARVEAKVEEREDGSVALLSEHNGYFEQFGKLHSRTLQLSPQGDRLEGIDRIWQPTVLASTTHRNLSFSIHFHLPPSASATRGPEPQTSDILLPGGERWRMLVQGAQIGIEESTHFARATGPTQSAQIVLRGVAVEDTEVRWRLMRLKDGMA